jgi:hypothetical protein
MSENTKKSGKTARREQRLAAALRENLRRRKAQLRGRADVPVSTGEEKPATPQEGGKTR